MKDDVQLQNIWPFSSYGPDKTCYPPIQLITGHEFSFEEIRWLYYQTTHQSTGGMQFQSQMQTLWQQSQQARQQIAQQPAKALEFMISKMAASKAVIGGNGAWAGAAAHSSTAAMNRSTLSGPSAFSIPPSGGLRSNTSAFQSQSSANAPAFAQVSSGVFGGNNRPIVGSSATFGQSAFDTTRIKQNAFGQSTGISTGLPQQQLQQPQPQSSFTRPVFGQLPRVDDGTKPAISAPAFGNPSASFPPPATPNLTALSADDQRKWSGETFEFGAIPEDEPPAQVC